MKTLYIVATVIAASVPFIVPVAGAAGISVNEALVMSAKTSIWHVVAILAWGLLGMSLLKAAR